jgi:glycosyltransferase involved in cell wall biosynthesis
MKVLFVTTHVPLPPYSGGRRREFELIRHLAATVDIHVVAVSKSFAEDQMVAPQLRRYCRSVHVFPANDELDPIASAGAGIVPQVWRNSSAPAKSMVANLLRHEPIDVIHCEGFSVRQMVPIRPGVPVLVVEQNMEHTLYEQRSALAQDVVARRAYQRLAELTVFEARRCWRQSAGCGAVTLEDLSVIQALEPSVPRFWLPDGCDHDPDLEDGYVGTCDPAVDLDGLGGDRPVALFVANFAYSPNVDAVRFLFAEILPAVLREIPELTTLVVGNAPTQEIRELDGQRGIRIVGRVRSLHAYYRRATVVLAPLRIGGGIKVKVLEALARRKVIIATSIAAQGFGRTFSALIVRDDPRCFATAMTDVIRDTTRRAMLERSAAIERSRLPTWRDAAERVRDAYRAVGEGLPLAAAT